MWFLTATTSEGAVLQKIPNQQYSRHKPEKHLYLICQLIMFRS